MKRHLSNSSRFAFTLIEVLVVIAIIAVLAALLLRVRSGPRPTIPQCMSNQRQIAIGLIIFVDDSAGKFPWQLSATNHGTMEDALLGNAPSNFKVLSNFLLRTERLICPSDKSRLAAGDFAHLDRTNLSYFASLDCITNSHWSILAGDRHLQVNGQPVKPGLLLFPTNAAVGWTRELHPGTQIPKGVLAFADGHVESPTEKLSGCFQRQNLEMNRLVMP